MVTTGLKFITAKKYKQHSLEVKIDHPPIIDYEDSDYQTSFWDQGGRIYEDQAEAVALKRLLPKEGNLLLELGAGAGRNTPRYSGFNRIVLLDYSLSQLQQAQSRLGALEKYIFVAADVYKLPFVSGLFDCATMIRTIHHLTDPATAIHQVRKVVANEGIFILEFANKKNLKSILRYLIGLQDWSPFSPESVELTKLNFDFHPRSIRKWLEENNFIINRQLTVSHFRVKVIKQVVPYQILVNMDSVLQLTGSMWQLTPSVFLRAAASGYTPSPETGSFFCCPKCSHSPLNETQEALNCPACNSRWLIRGGIYDFRTPFESD